MKLSISLVFVLVFVTYAQASHLASNNELPERRIALVLGNTDYETSPLLNPVNDARDMAQALREFGFEVVFQENLAQQEMKRAIQSFGDRISQGGIGLFYFAGHAVQVNGHNYLIPVAARISTEAEVADKAIDVGLILAQLENARNSMNFVILDACRNNPFTRKGRASSNQLVPMDAPCGTLIAYATAPGAVTMDGRGRNGLYTQELLRALRTPGLSIEEVFKRVRISVQRLTSGRQTPWESSSLTGDFYFSRIDERWLEGSWEGTLYQGSARAVRAIKLEAQNNAYAIEYPALTCRGELALLQRKNGQATFRETSSKGRNQCADGGEIVLERVSNSQLVFKHFSPRTNEIVASAILNKVEFKAQTQRGAP